MTVKKKRTSKRSTTRKTKKASTKKRKTTTKRKSSLSGTKRTGIKKVIKTIKSKLSELEKKVG